MRAISPGCPIAVLMVIGTVELAHDSMRDRKRLQHVMHDLHATLKSGAASRVNSTQLRG